MKRVAVAAVVVLLGMTPARARAQTTTTTLPPLEDVTLRGRVLAADGSPVANTPLRVDAVNDSGFAVLGFFFTAGFSTLACFGEDKSLCPLPNSKRFASTTDAHGNYAFTFHNAHRRGIQTDTDYILSIGVPSRHAAASVVVASYELELQDALHDAPDLRMWDPAVTIKPAERDYEFVYDRRPVSKNGGEILFGGKPSNLAVPERSIGARAVEDQSFSYVANAAKDLTAKGTIYHQRFTAAPVTQKGTLVPLSRGKPCTATRADGASAHCGYTDGDLVTPGVVDPNPCAEFLQAADCQPPVRSVTIDLGAAKSVGEVRDRCSCTLEASTDAQSWHNLPGSGTFGAQSMRYVRVSTESLGFVPEISVWPPWPGSSGGGVSLLPGHPRGGATGGSRPWVLAVVALVLLGLVGGWALGRRGRRSGVTEGTGSLERASMAPPDL